MFEGKQSMAPLDLLQYVQRGAGQHVVARALARVAQFDAASDHASPCHFAAREIPEPHVPEVALLAL